jgi:hypothetical protein
MRLPVAIQTAFEESERQFQQVLARLGLTREKLTQVADKLQTKTKTPPPARPVASKGRRVIHV